MEENGSASGGYYVSAPTDRIYVSNETLTGSIGVIMQMYSLEGLLINMESKSKILPQVR